MFGACACAETANPTYLNKNAKQNRCVLCGVAHPGVFELLPSERFVGHPTDPDPYFSEQNWVINDTVAFGVNAGSYLKLFFLSSCLSMLVNNSVISGWLHICVIFILAWFGAVASHSTIYLFLHFAISRGCPRTAPHLRKLLHIFIFSSRF
jgi:hypothetical protein